MFEIMSLWRMAEKVPEVVLLSLDRLPVVRQRVRAAVWPSGAGSRRGPRIGETPPGEPFARIHS